MERGGRKGGLGSEAGERIRIRITGYERKEEKR